MVRTKERVGKQPANPNPKKPVARKPTAAEKGKGKKSTSAPLEIDAAFAPRKYGVTLTSVEARQRWSRLSRLNHKACRFLDIPTVTSMGIADDLLALISNLGFSRLFTADYLAYKGITLEFLSTVAIQRDRGTPISITFQLGNEPRSLTVDELNAIVNGPEDGSYIGNHSFDAQDMWKRICYMEAEAIKWFNPKVAKATSIRNPVFRYLHRLITSTILSRMDVGTCQAYDIHIMVAATMFVTQHAGCYLADHFAAQANLHGNSRIAIGAMITPIATHFGVQINEPPISTDIRLDRKSLKQQWMLHQDSNPNTLHWKIITTEGHYLFRLPNTPLTTVMGNDPGVQDRWNLSSQEHLEAMWLIGEAPAARGEGGDDEERAEEEAAYEQGGEHPQGDEHAHEEEEEHPQGAPPQSFRMRAPDFEGFEQRYYAYADAHHNEQMEAYDNYYLQTQQYVEEQVGLVRQEVVDLRREQQAWMEQQRVYQEQQAQYFRMIEEMHRSWPYHPQDPQDPPPSL